MSGYADWLCHWANYYSSSHFQRRSPRRYRPVTPLLPCRTTTALPALDQSPADFHVSQTAMGCTGRSLFAILIYVILLAYSRLGGLKGEALQKAIFLLLLFVSEAGKKQQQKNYSRGPAAPSLLLQAIGVMIGSSVSGLTLFDSC